MGVVMGVMGMWGRVLSFALSLLLLIAAAAAPDAAALGKLDGYAEQGGQRHNNFSVFSITRGGSTQTNPYSQQSYPSATITIYLTGTSTLATLYSDTALTAKSNPFTADSTGYWSAYLADGCYDVRSSGGGIASPFTRSYVCTESAGAGMIDVTSYGADKTGAVASQAAILNAVTAAAGSDILFPPGTYLTTSRMDIASSVRINGYGATIAKQHSSIGIRIRPVGVTAGLVASGATTTSVTVTGAAWTTDEHVGKWASMCIAVDDDCSGAQQDRRVTANTANTLSFDYALDHAPTTSETVTFYTPVPRVEISGLTIDGTGSLGGAGIIFMYVDTVILRDFNSINHAGNACSIDWINKGRIYGGKFNNSQFGIFAYHSQDLIAFGHESSGSTGEYGTQFKDCQNSHMIEPYGEGNAQHAFNIKSSGLNPARNVSIVGGSAINSGSYAYKAHSLIEEGTTYQAENFQIIRPQVRGGVGGLQATDSAGTAVMDLQVIGGQIDETTSIGAQIAADNTRVTGLKIANGGIRAMEIDSAYVTVTGSKFENNNRTGGASHEVRIAPRGYNITVSGNEFIHTVSASASTFGITETLYSTGTISATNGLPTISCSACVWRTGGGWSNRPITINGNSYTISTIDTATTATLTGNFNEATASGLTYTISGTYSNIFGPNRYINTTGTYTDYSIQSTSSTIALTNPRGDVGTVGRVSTGAIFGMGSPNTAITAPIGTVFHRIDGASGTSFYVKESGSGNTGWRPLGLGPAVGSNITSAATIAPTSKVHVVTATNAIDTITVLSGLADGDSITLLPTAAWTTTTAGNIAVATTAVAGKAMTLTWNATTVKWYPSY